MSAGFWREIAKAALVLLLVLLALLTACLDDTPTQPELQLCADTLVVGDSIDCAVRAANLHR